MRKHTMTNRPNRPELKKSINKNSHGAQRQNQPVYQQIFDAILAQNLLPGTKLPEDELATIFEVSRTVVRSALQKLAHSRIIDIQPNRGAIVASPGSTQAKEILAARRLIEGAIIREAVSSVSKNDLQQLRAMVGEEQTNFELENREIGIRLSGNFHLALAAVSGNTTLAGFMKVLVPQTSLIIAKYEKPGFTHCSHDEHFHLLDVIEAGDTEKAIVLMDEHLQHIEDKLNLAGENLPKDLHQIFTKAAK